MNDSKVKDTLQRLAHAVVRNEIVSEHFMTQERPATVDEIGSKVREVDEQLAENTHWHRRFPALFPQE